jgi:hypothetical protein
LPDDAGPLSAVPFNEFLISEHVAPRQGRPTPVGDRLLPGTPNLLLGDLESYALAKRFAGIWGPELRRMTLVRLAAGLDRAVVSGIATTERPLAVIKEVSASHAADEVMRIFPASRMIFLVRDGRDIVDSQIHALGDGGWKVGAGGPRFKSRRERLEFVRSESTIWACNTDTVSAAYEAHPPDLRYRIRYEDLRRDTAGALAPLRAWMGLDDEPATVGEIVSRHAFENIPAAHRGRKKAKRAAQPGLWRQDLTRREQRVANEIMGPRLEPLGYEV